MAEDDVRYEFKTVQALRGTEGRSIAKWQEAGWEFVDQSQGTLRTTLNFRRPKPKVPRRLIAVTGGVLVLLAIVGGIASAIQSEDAQEPARSSPSESRVPSEKPLETPAPKDSVSTEAAAERVLTAANSKELAALLRADQCDQSIGRFAEKYGGRTIEFDGAIVVMAKPARDVKRLDTHDFDTHYDMLLGPGDNLREAAIGITFRFDRVSVPDLNFTGPNTPEYVGAGDPLRLVAKVGEFDADRCLFHVEPVSTEVR